MLEIKASCYQFRTVEQPGIVQVWKHELVQWGMAGKGGKSDMGIVSMLWATMYGTLKDVRLSTQKVLKRPLRPLGEGVDYWVEV